MDASRRAPGYDLFKLIVAIFLLILAFILMWISPPQSPALLSTPLPSTAAILSQPTVTPTAPDSASLPVTPSPLPSPTETSISEPTPTSRPTPTGTPVAETTVTPTAGTPVPTACDASRSRSRLQTGVNATILRRLNFRSSPGIRDNWLLTNISGTQVEVVGGPECVPYWAGAYLWWQVKLSDGRTGWSAEGSLHGSFYFMEPSS